jgi:NAD(P)H-flavin reductase
MTTAAPALIAANPWLSHTVRIAEITAEVPGVATYHFEFADPAQACAYRFRPGQFNMIYLPGVGESAISLSAHPDARDRWAHTIRAAGNVTQGLAQLGVGATLGLRGPYGSCWPIEQIAGFDVVLAAGGIGLAPLRPVICHILDHRSEFGRVNLVYGARTPDALLYAREYDDWSAGGVLVQTTVDRAAAGWNGNVGVVTLLLDRLRLPRPQQTALLVCGPDVMMHFTAKSALNRGISADRMWLSTERNMQCAVGFCGHCQLGPTFVCKEGPIYRYDRIAPFLRVEGL